jgi:glucan phosphoethanolaminetransferase (alkaline phosphatase superfamily)
MSNIDWTEKCYMKNPKFVLAFALASALLVVCVVNAVGNVALVTKVGPTPVFSLAAIVLASVTFIASWNMRSYLVAGLLAASGIIFMVPALNAMGYSFEVIVFPGPILGIIFGLVIFGLGVTNGIRSARTVTPPVPSQ